MAINYLNNIDLHLNEIQNVKLQSVPTLSGTTEGQVLFDSINKYIAYYSNGWNRVANTKDIKTKFDSLFTNGIIKSEYLPSYIDDIIECKTGPVKDKQGAWKGTINVPPGPQKGPLEGFPNEGEIDKIYLNIGANEETSNYSFRWSGSQYIIIASDLLLGDSHKNAFYGDYGKKLTTFFTNWDNGNVGDGEGIANKAAADASGLNIATNYFRKTKGANAISIDQTVDNVTNFKDLVKFDAKKGINIGDAVINYDGKFLNNNAATKIANTLDVLNLATFDGTKGIQIGGAPNPEDLSKSKGVLFTWDNVNHALKIEGNIYATGQVTAGGIGNSESGGAGYDRLDVWTDYKENEHQVLGANLGIELKNYVGYNGNPVFNKSLNQRISDIETSGATSISTTGNGNAVTSVNKKGTTITFSKDETFSRVRKYERTPLQNKIIINHDLNTDSVIVSIYSKSNNRLGEQVLADITIKSKSQIVIEFGTGVETSESFIIVVLG